MKVFIERENKHLELETREKGYFCAQISALIFEAKTGTELLNNLGINSSTVLLVRNDEVILIEETLNESDDLKILSVVSGG